MLKLYNTLSRKKEIFKPIKKGRVGLYGCGPTVYNFVHLGNLRAYVFVDLLKRYLKFRKFKVTHVMNITDVDDKTIRNSQKEKKTLKDFTQFYFKAFMEDLAKINIEPADIIPFATKHIKEMVTLVKTLDRKGYTYQASDGSVYFNIKKFKPYGKLALLEKQSLKENADRRLGEDEYEKEDAGDFVLWKSWKPDDGKVCWVTELGKGRPGWHIECSAMSMKYLGQSFDIHAGGVDLIFPHHTNEIAQSEAATGKKFSNFWLHNGHLTIEGQKMSKSLNNFYTLRDNNIKKFNPLLIRIMLLKAHYRQTLDFSLKGLEESKAIAEKFINLLSDLDAIKNKTGTKKIGVKRMIAQNRKALIASLDDDLNISLFLSALFDFMNQINKSITSLSQSQAREIKKYILEVDSILGFAEKLYKQYQATLKKTSGLTEIKKIIANRVAAKRAGDFKKADALRDRLAKKGLGIKDTKNSYTLKLLNFFN